MPSEVFKAFIADSLSTINQQQLRNIILAMMEKPNTNIDDVGEVILAEKAKKGTVVSEGTSAGQDIETSDAPTIVAATEEGSVVSDGTESSFVELLGRVDQEFREECEKDSRESTGEGVKGHPVGQGVMAESSGKRKRKSKILVTFSESTRLTRRYRCFAETGTSVAPSGQEKEDCSRSTAYTDTWKKKEDCGRAEGDWEWRGRRD